MIQINFFRAKSLFTPSRFSTQVIESRKLFVMATVQNGEAVNAAASVVKDLSGMDSEIGFSRKEMFQSKLVGTVKEYDTHLFVCVDSKAETWPKGKINDISENFSEELKARKKDISRNVKLTIAEASGFEGVKNGDVLLFPDMKHYSDITEESVSKFVDETLIGSSTVSFPEHPLSSIHFFVCCHSQWDTRCGACGPPLVSEFRALAKARGLENDVTVWPCSHIGGHKYAGNVILFNARPDGTVTGDWYGYVTPKDVPTLLDAAIDGKIIDNLWRGGMGLSKEAQETEQSLRLQGCGVNCACMDDSSEKVSNARELKPEVGTKAEKEVDSKATVKCSNFSADSSKTAVVVGIAVAIGVIATYCYIRANRST